MSEPSLLYRISFTNQGELYEVYARSLYQSDLFGFLEIEDLVFGDRNNLVVDPSQEKLRTEFEGVSRSYIPIQAIHRIDEVRRAGSGKIRGADNCNNIAHLPFPHTNPGGNDQSGTDS